MDQVNDSSSAQFDTEFHNQFGFWWRLICIDLEVEDANEWMAKRITTHFNGRPVRGRLVYQFK